MRIKLTDDLVHAIRVSGLTDAFWARTLKTSVGVIFNARTGVTHKGHSTPPDKRPRRPGGRYAAKEAIR